MELSGSSHRHSGTGLQNFLAPLFEVSGGDVPGTVVIYTGLVNRQPDGFHIVEHLGHCQHSESIGHQLGIFHGTDFHAPPQLKVNNVNDLIRNDDHISRAEAVGSIVGNIDTLLHCKNRLFALTLGILDFTDDKGNIIIHGFQQVIRIVVRHRAFCAKFQVLLNEVFCQSVSGRAFCGIGTLLIGKLLSQHQGRGTVQGTMQSRR